MRHEIVSSIRHFFLQNVTNKFLCNVVCFLTQNTAIYSLLTFMQVRNWLTLCCYLPYIMSVLNFLSLLPTFHFSEIKRKISSLSSPCFSCRPYCRERYIQIVSFNRVPENVNSKYAQAVQAKIENKLGYSQFWKIANTVLNKVKLFFTFIINSIEPISF